MMAPVLCGASGFDSLKKTYAGINTLEAKFHQQFIHREYQKSAGVRRGIFLQTGKGISLALHKAENKIFSL